MLVSSNHYYKRGVSFSVGYVIYGGKRSKGRGAWEVCGVGRLVENNVLIVATGNILWYQLPLDKLKSGKFSLSRYCDLQSVIKITLVESATSKTTKRLSANDRNHFICEILNFFRVLIKLSKHERKCEKIRNAVADEWRSCKLKPSITNL